MLFWLGLLPTSIHFVKYSTPTTRNLIFPKACENGPNMNIPRHSKDHDEVSVVNSVGGAICIYVVDTFRTCQHIVLHLIAL